MSKIIYLIGSLRNPEVPKIGKMLRNETGYDVFDDWFAGGPEADDAWKRYEETRGRTYDEALFGRAAEHVFDYDHFHLDRADIGVLVLPAGKSGHLELGYLIGQKKPGLILLENGVDRWDVMYKFATVYTDLTALAAGVMRHDQYLFGV